MHIYIYISIYIAPLYHDFILAYNIQKTRVSIGGRGRGEVFKGNPISTYRMHHVTYKNYNSCGNSPEIDSYLTLLGKMPPPDFNTFQQRFK